MPHEHLHQPERHSLTMRTALILFSALVWGCGGSEQDPSLSFTDVNVSGPDAVDGGDAAQDGTDGTDATDGAPEDASTGDDAGDDGFEDVFDTTPDDVLVGEEVDQPDGLSDAVDVQPPDVPPLDTDGGDLADGGDAADVVVPDVSDGVDIPDVPPPDVEEPDVPLPEDTGPDADPPDIGPPPAEGRLYRITTLGWVSPPLCYPDDSDQCTDITGFANGFLDDMWNDPEDPTDVGIELAGAGEAAIDASLGGLACVRDNGELVGCVLMNSPPPATLDLVWQDASGDCDGIPGPCFATSGAVPSLAIQIGDYQMGLSNASLGAHVSGETPDQVLSSGALAGFLPEKIAKTFVFNVGVTVSLAELLEKTPTTVVNGQAGWEVVLTYEAAEVLSP